MVTGPAARHVGPRRCCRRTGTCQGDTTPSKSSAQPGQLTQQVPAIARSHANSAFPTTPIAADYAKPAHTPNNSGHTQPCWLTPTTHRYPRSNQPPTASATLAKPSAQPLRHDPAASWLRHPERPARNRRAHPRPPPRPPPDPNRSTSTHPQPRSQHHRSTSNTRCHHHTTCRRHPQRACRPTLTRQIDR